MEICRACMSDSVTLVDIFCDQPLPDYQFSLADMLNDFAGFQVKRDDKLPQKICVSCGLNAQIAFTFKRRFQQSHQLLCMKVMENENVVVDLPHVDPSNELTLKQTNSTLKINKKSKSKKKSTRKLRKSKDVSGKDGNKVISSKSGNDDVIIVDVPDSNSTGELDQDTRVALDSGPEKATPTSHRYPLRQSQRQKPLNVTKSLFRISKLRSFKCDQCRSTFAKMENLSRHQLCHAGERDFKCLHCSKTYSEKSKLQMHIRTHKMNHQHMCDQCSKSFSRKSDLHQHLCSHSDTRPFQCSQCQLTFKLKHHLKRHLSIHAR